jgi:hypothetical protein
MNTAPIPQRLFIVLGLVLLAACGADLTEGPGLQVTAVSPGSGPLTGGTSVTITGANFADVTEVSIGGNALRALKVVNAREITGSTPSSASSGAKDVVVTSSTRGSGTCRGCFSYGPSSSQ